MALPRPGRGSTLATQVTTLAGRVLEAKELDPDVEFVFGLECVLDGLAARLGR